MEQLLLHLIGDYITQTHFMATNKQKLKWVALMHAIVYGLPFLLIGSYWAVVVIISTHAVIDHYGLAKYVVFAKNNITNITVKWTDTTPTGYPKGTPDFLAVWLLIIADNTIHLCINYAALRWL